MPGMLDDFYQSLQQKYQAGEYAPPAQYTVSSEGHNGKKENAIQVHHMVAVIVIGAVALLWVLGWVSGGMSVQLQF